jgi:hypothetical protein
MTVEPSTEAGRRMLDSLPDDWHPINREIVADHIVAIESESRNGSELRKAVGRYIVAVSRRATGDVTGQELQNAYEAMYDAMGRGSE